MALTLASNAITFTDSTSLSSGIIGTPQLSAGSVTTEKIASSTVTFDKISQNSGSFNFRNKIINGSMNFTQRLSHLWSSISNQSKYAADRWQVGFVGTGLSCSVDRPIDDGPQGTFFNNRSLEVTVTSAKNPIGTSDYCIIQQSIEAGYLCDLQWGTPFARPATLSFWVKSSIPGTYGSSVRALNGSFPTPTNVSCYIFSYTINQANTWEYKTVTIPGLTTHVINPTNQGLAGVDIIFDLGCGSGFTVSTPNQWYSLNRHSFNEAVKFAQTNGATFSLTNVQFEVGSVATPFEDRPNSVEFNLCLRYFEYVFFSLQKLVNITSFNGSQINVIQFSQQKRATPTEFLLYSGINISVNSYGKVLKGTSTEVAASFNTDLGIGVDARSFRIWPQSTILPNVNEYVTGYVGIGAEL